MKNENTGENLSEEMRKQKEIEELLHELMKKDIETDHRIATERKIAELAEDLKDIEHKNSVKRTLEDLKLKEEKYKLIDSLKKEMHAAAKLLEFEHAAFLRDKIKKLQGK